MTTKKIECLYPVCGCHDECQAAAPNDTRSKTTMHTIAAITETTRDRLPIDLDMEMSAGGQAYRFEVEGSAQPGFVLVVPGRAGVAWGGDATWIDLRADETAEDAARIVINDADETARRA